MEAMSQPKATPAFDDSPAPSGSDGKIIEESLRLMRVAQANALFAEVAATARKVKAAVEARKGFAFSMLRFVGNRLEAIRLIDCIKVLFESMNVTAMTSTMIDEAREALVSIGNADLSNAEMRAHTTDVLEAMQRSFSATSFS
jgi:hypothetical protein